MKTVVALFAVMGLISLVGCGANSCSSPISENAYPVNATIQSCTLQAGAQVNIQVQLCPSCQDVSPSCPAEFRQGEFELPPVFETCEETRSCPFTNSCGTVDNSVTCTVTAPGPGTYPVMVPDPNTGFRSAGTITVVASGGSTSCSL